MIEIKEEDILMALFIGTSADSDCWEGAGEQLYAQMMGWC